jgi:ubiquitin carboxyl-terminal hydrolase 9/13
MSPQTPQPQSPGKEENKESSEYKKKMALASGPIIQLEHESGKKYGMEESLFTSLREMFEEMAQHDSRNGIVSPKRPTDLVRQLNSVFSVPMHQDAHECLNFALNQIVEDLENYEKEVQQQNLDLASNGKSDLSSEDSLVATSANPRWVHELFEGTMSSEIKCLTCQKTSSREEAYLDLSVDLGLYSSVTSCLLKFSEEEMLNERNKFHCDSCNGLQEAEKRMKIKKTPKILALHLKRFTYTEDLQRLQKLHHRVAYPYYLRLSNLTDESEDQDKLYELYAVVVHIGMSPYQGHYVSIIKTQSSGWLLFDDENVEPVDKTFVRSFFGSEQGLACAYVLFYKETTFEAAERDMDEEDRSLLTLPVILGSKEQPFNAKTNGNFSNGSYIPPSPLTEDMEYTNLDRSVTAPLTSTNSVTITTVPLNHSTTTPMMPFLSRKKSAGISKVLQEQDESESGSVVDTQSDVSRRGESPNKSMYPNGTSRLPRKTLPSESNNGYAPDETLRVNGPYDHPRDPTDGTSAKFFSGGMNRFKSGSKSMKGKPKLWGSIMGKAEAAAQGAPPAQPPTSQPLLNARLQQEIPPMPPPKLNRAPEPSATLPRTILPTPSPYKSMIPPDSSYASSDTSSRPDRSLPDPGRPPTARTMTPNALPVMLPQEPKKKEKRGFFGLGKKKH